MFSPLLLLYLRDTRQVLRDEYFYKGANNLHDDIIYKYEPLWGSWKIDKLIGTGSMGKVYKVYREEYEKKFLSAVKVISVPTDEHIDIFNSMNKSNNKNLIEKYLKDIVKMIMNEIELLYVLKGTSNIISYEDHLVKKVDGKNEWHIFIRMEYATSLNNYLYDKNMSQDEVIKLGIDLCKGLKICHSNDILHRDIKEANIFISNNGVFKLGDFSVSKSISDKSYAQSKVGTMNYMPPEIVNGRIYNKSADIYSLGIVLYKLLNNKRLPFMGVNPNEFKQSDIEEAYIKRIRGDKMPPPSRANDDLAKIILKACSYNVKERYNLVENLEEDLYDVLYGSKIRDTNNLNNEFKNSNSYDLNNNTINIFSLSHKENELKDKKNLLIGKKIPIIAVFVVISLLFGFIYFKIDQERNNKREIIKIDRKSNFKLKQTINSRIDQNEKETKIYTTSKGSITPTKTPVETTPKKSEELDNNNSNESILNLVRNSEAENELTSWNIDEWAGGTGKYETTSETKTKGSNSFKITKSNMDGIASLQQRLTVEKGKKYEIAYYLKTENITTDGNGGAYVYFQFYNDDGKLDGGASEMISGTTKWKYYKTSFTMPKTNANVTIYLAINNGKGIGYFDDVKLYEVE